MKRVTTLLALSFVFLSACANDVEKSNSISAVELTEKERAILTTTSDKSFVFDFSINSEYKEVSVWVEKYQSGTLIEEIVGSLSAEAEGNGTIIFATSKLENDGEKQTFNIGISSNGHTGSVSNIEINPEDLVDMASVWGQLEGEKKSIDDELVLANISYSNDQVISSLSTDFFNDVENHIDELAQYDLVYLLKAEFKK
ncbi:MULTISPECIES: hypothetical protein [Planococcus]|uniref:Lipoprotein n=1 Tax=Planococcus kocurii TaxID=1374 RepID=A0ABM5WZ77_9BACL|nr:MULTISPECIES: hypothetical protein [Planococcus]ALS78761.1 hypothetical protein AUO94_08880 [Planococcus kocurii]KAA0955204.1 hypothetical protein FQ085_16160 [Planococcus sp. ANT_H30]MDJ0333370.1 hypothetical protein [Planococcus sp. S3-L1]